MVARLPLIDTGVLRPSETALALRLVTAMDLLRLKTIARLHARGLPAAVSWEDLLQEALTRVITGARVRPEGLSVVAFLAGIMRSLRSEHWRRHRAARRAGEVEAADAAPDPERAVMAQQQLQAILTLFEDDPAARAIITGLAEGRAPEEIAAHLKISRTDYDSARRRIRRRLLREGLTCGEI